MTRRDLVAHCIRRTFRFFNLPVRSPTIFFADARPFAQNRANRTGKPVLLLDRFPQDPVTPANLTPKHEGSGSDHGCRFVAGEAGASAEQAKAEQAPYNPIEVVEVLYPAEPATA